MILLVDNYDSFTYNLVQRLGEIDPALDLQVHRNDRITLEEIERLRPSHLIISPGPCTPSEAGISCAVVSRFAGEIPILGVCLGHQAIGQATGATIVRAKRLMHGKTDWIHHDSQGLFEGLENPLEATRYHSLVIDPPTLESRFRRGRLERRARRLARDHGHPPPRLSAVRAAISSREFLDPFGLAAARAFSGGYLAQARRTPWCPACSALTRHYGS